MSGEHYQRTGREGIGKLLELQGQVVELRSVLESYNIYIDHVHWFPQTRFLKPSIEIWDLENQCCDFLEQHAIKGTVDPLYRYFSAQSLLADGIGVTPEDRWQIDQTLLFPWVDFVARLQLSDEAAQKAAPYVVTRQSGFNLNTTQIEGTRYEIDIAVGKTIPRNETTFTRQAEKMPWFYRFEEVLGINRIIDAVVVSYDSQRLIGALLGARV